MKGIVVTTDNIVETRDFGEPLYRTVGEAVGGYMSPTSQSNARQILSSFSKLIESTISLYSSLMLAALMPVSWASLVCVHRFSPRRVDSKILIMVARSLSADDFTALLLDFVDFGRNIHPFRKTCTENGGPRGRCQIINAN